MTLHDYEVSKAIEVANYPFYALIMAAMRKADSSNQLTLAFGFPEVWKELQYRYWSAGGLMPGEDGYTAAGDDNLAVAALRTKAFPAMTS